MTRLALIVAATLLHGSGPSIRLEGQSFVLEQEGRTVSVPLSRKPAAEPKAVAYREGDAFAVWDVDRGLSIRKGKALVSSWLPELPRSKRLFSEEELAKNKKRLAAKEIEAGASALAGSVRIGSVAYFLVQWRDKNDEPWLEALVKVDLKDKKPIAELAGRFDGFSVARGRIGDELVGFEERLMVVAEQGEAWGIARFDPASHLFSFDIVGSRLAKSEPIGSRTVVVQEKTSYGTVLLARVYLPNGTRRNLAEGRGSFALIDDQEPLIAKVRDARGVALRNLDSGAELRLPGSSRIDRSELGVIVSSPPQSPTAALLYDPVRWDRLALWTAGPQVSGGGG
ncbi:MAG: hypothetical protein M9921_15185 [Fimbriimonadaceae bacterium]|nr:hypothetical protein [Chthonomonadaceae bacterium]MCO5298191.1 hypothetical protein [Fimbriimonadaceae bacterium]